MKQCSPHAACPCGKTASAAHGKPAVMCFADCCGRWLDGGADAPDALHLMRSRYSAFVLEREDYLRATWHSSTRPASIAFESGVKWLGLEVRAYASDEVDRAMVEFVARSKAPGTPALRLHERSRFVYEAGIWWYLDGELQ